MGAYMDKDEDKHKRKDKHEIQNVWVHMKDINVKNINVSNINNINDNLNNDQKVKSLYKSFPTPVCIKCPNFRKFNFAIKDKLHHLGKYRN